MVTPAAARTPKRVPIALTLMGVVLAMLTAQQNRMGASHSVLDPPALGTLAAGSPAGR
jgi:hypothetical protein